MCIFDICKELLLISKVKGRPYLESMLRYSDVRMLVSNCCCCRIWCFCLLILSNVCCKIKKWHCLWKITALEHAIDPCIQRWLENYLFLFWRCDPSKFANSPYFQCPSSLNSSSSSYVEASATSKNWQGTRHTKFHWKTLMFCNHIVMKCFLSVSEDNEQTQPKKHA